MKIHHFLQLIRYKNLLMLIFMMLLLVYKLKESGTPLFNANLLLLLLATICIAAGGNVINDILDVKIDLINKPEKVIIDKHISKKKGMQWYYVLTFLGILLGTYLSYRTHNLSYTIIFIGTAALLYGYSKWLKRIALLGNLTVSLVIVMSVLLVPLFIAYESTDITTYFLIGYSFFAFILNFIREIIKDIEDMDGDYNQRLKTLPIIMGKSRTQNIVLFLSFIPLILSFWVVSFYLDNYKTAMAIVLSVCFPLIYFIYHLYHADTKKEFHQLSTFLKVIMFCGLLSVLVIL